MATKSDIYFTQHAVGQMANLAYLIGSTGTRECLVVDPAWDVDRLVDQPEQDGMKITGALVSHFHPDHVGGKMMGRSIEGLDRLLERCDVPVHVNKHEAAGLAKVTGVSGSDVIQHEGGDVVQVGDVRIRLLHTPGHTPGSQCFLVEEEAQPGHLVSGDTLFLGGCGRVDLPGSDPEAMYESLHGTLKRRPDETLLFPGHLYSTEASSTMGAEKQTNPFLRVSSLEMFLGFMGY
jgi:hydroxyacylglutathione hydrolase